MFRKFMTSAALPLVLVSLATLPAHAEEAKTAPAQPKLPVIVVTKATERSMVDRVIATGSIKPVDEVYIQPLVDGLSIKTVNADIGDEVKAGAVLATLNEDALTLQKSQLQANRAKAEAAAAQYQAQVLEAQANLDDMTRQRDRTQRLSQSGTTTQSQVEQANAQAEVAAARLNAARQAVSVGQADIKVVDAQIADVDLNLSRTGVTTPVAGVVSAKNARMGAIASGSGNPLFTLIRDGAIELVADLSETDIRKVKIGQKALVSLAGSGSKIEGKVRLVSPTVDPTSRLGAVHVVIDSDSGARSGMYASAEIVIEETNGLALPLSAVISNREGSTARKVENDVVKQVKIETGIQDSGFVQVVSGLSSGDTVVAKAGAFVRDGDHIAPVADDAPASN